MGGATRFFLLLTTPFPLISPRPSLIRLRLGFARSPRLSPSSLSSYSTSTLSSPSHSPSPRLFPSVNSSQQFHSQATTVGVGDDYFVPSPWPEWSTFVERLTSTGYLNQVVEDDEFVSTQGLTDEFVNAARACLAFARDRPNLIRSLSRRDIDVVVGKGSPFLFKQGHKSAGAMKWYLAGDETNVSESDKACTVDLMRFLLSYTINPAESLERNSPYNEELVESSVRSLLREMANAIYIPSQSDLSGSVLNQYPESYGQTGSRSFRQNIEMKRGDWVCPKCTFMNFARNVKCLECEEVRPKRQLTGGEWECPQCDFFNYGKNMVCLRCDCKRPGESSFNTTISSSNNFSVDSRLAANKEKAERWFSKVSQLDNNSSENGTIADEDFPEIMPLRKGINRFVVSTRKTPLERRLANSQYQRNLGEDGNSENNMLETSGTVNRSLDDILGRATSGEASGYVSKQYGSTRGSNSNYVPFVPLPADAFASKPPSSKEEEIENPMRENDKSAEKEQMDNNNNKDKEKEQAEKTERWFKKVAELHDSTDLASAISDEDFPEIMPMRKGENRFVVGKKKDRSMTSPMYKKRMAMEQTGNTNFVPFVPFPPDYFTKKETPQPEGVNSSKSTIETIPEKTDYNAPGENLTERRTNSVSHLPNNGFSENTNSTRATNSAGNSTQPSVNRNPIDGWTGKSLEGSAVKETDPLDMSEEAKAERWFRRAAQIKDISELSQIPDEDFPSIMPMRKGVNRFVVSKRKTPLERRLTSPQYRRNLPVVSSEPLKNDNDGN